jgi:hypothetical protein
MALEKKRNIITKKMKPTLPVTFAASLPMLKKIHPSITPTIKCAADLSQAMCCEQNKHAHT